MTPSLREDLCGQWVSLDGSRALRVSRTQHGIWVTVTAGLGAVTLAHQRPATWHPREAGAEASLNALRRLDRLSMELDEPGRGPTYELMFARENPAPETFGGLQWIPLDAATPRSQVRVFSEWGASFNEAVMGPWDDFVEEETARFNWVSPLVNYRPVG
jgi:hypothetical protein